ncbi:hypothetical protein [Paenibacillus whitsoniae]|uniref:Uncharacterized protein n=1 Tax=Paenibacillus whitsoniae TaxID=2496558 RepID=A0A430J4Q1_9BACL|nr:hypothetical protein [Paenibacillus whitsoniae]RTE02219.1 hypothetical protein EJQ19_29770 [Paenibacillus whitsoniae]
MKFSLPGMLASLISLSLSITFLFWNPYTNAAVGEDTILIVTVMLILPACLGVLAACRKSRPLMAIALIWSLPYSLYLSLAAIPSIFNGFALVLLLYLAALLLTIKKRSSPRKQG